MLVDSGIPCGNSLFWHLLTERINKECFPQSLSQLTEGKQCWYLVLNLKHLQSVYVYALSSGWESIVCLITFRTATTQLFLTFVKLLPCVSSSFYAIYWTRTAISAKLIFAILVTFSVGLSDGLHIALGYGFRWVSSWCNSAGCCSEHRSQILIPGIRKPNFSRNLHSFDAYICLKS